MSISTVTGYMSLQLNTDYMVPSYDSGDVSAYSGYSVMGSWATQLGTWPGTAICKGFTGTPPTYQLVYNGTQHGKPKWSVYDIAYGEPNSTRYNNRWSQFMTCSIQWRPTINAWEMTNFVFDQAQVNYVSTNVLHTNHPDNEEDNKFEMPVRRDGTSLRWIPLGGGLGSPPVDSTAWGGTGTYYHYPNTWGRELDQQGRGISLWVT